MSRGRSRRQSIDEYLYGRSKYAKARSNKSNKQNHGKKVAFNSTSMNYKRNIVTKVDLHNHGIHQAKKRVIEECKYAQKDETIQFCHGHNHGTQIRDWIRDGPLNQSLESQNLSGRIWIKDASNTYFNRN
tara:strand:+ start:517 stop:906 length:390 start_codon:yes stop_codon:yes gene_type:complete